MSTPAHRQSRSKQGVSTTPAAHAASEASGTSQIVPASALQSKSLGALRSALPGYIAEGLTFLVSRPKLGKSWLMLDVALAIATGRTVLGTLQPETGDVLYLALDDGERRLQQRLAALLKEEKAWPRRLAVATQWRRASDGGLADIDEWCGSVANPVAVVIDSLDRFRSLQGGESAQVYDAIAKLQRIARAHRTAIVVVHHERRRGAGDPLDSIGMLAASSAIADTVLLLKPRDYGTVLYARGRDIEDSETMLAFDRASCRWAIAKPADAPTKSDARRAVLALFGLSSQPLSAAEIATATGRGRGAINTLLHRMLADGEVERAGRGRYVRAADPSEIVEYRWADGTLVARYRGGKLCKDVSSDEQPIGAPAESPDPDILQRAADA
jgi:hypothetical protein